MILIWKGRGLWVIPIILLGLYFTEYALELAYADENFYQREDWPKFLAGGVACALLLLFAKLYCSQKERQLVDQETGDLIIEKPKHSLFFIPVRGWAVLILIFSAIAAFSEDSAPDLAPETKWSARNFTRILEEPASATPTLFAPGMISDGMDQRDSAYSLDQKHFLYTLQIGRQSRIMHVPKTGKGWEAPRTASFSGEWRDLEPAFKPGSLDLYFASNRPLPGETEADDFNLWFTQWDGENWLQPAPLTDLNTDGNEFYPSLTQAGDLYFTSEQEGGAGGEDIWFAQPAAANPAAALTQVPNFLPPTPLGSGVNTAGGEFNAAIDPTGNHLIFGAARADGPGGGDLYISHQDATGNWSPATLLGGEINTDKLDFCPFFYGSEGEIWFTSRRANSPIAPYAGLRLLRGNWNAPGNGYGDLYRVKIELAAD
jgi:hypothetical protein